MVWVIVIGGIVVGLILILALVLGMVAFGAEFVLRRLRPRLEARVDERYPDPQTRLHEDYRANSFGLTSLGKAQARGNGALVLTPADVAFLQYVPDRSFVIPYRRITHLELTRSHLGKTITRDLVKISFTDENGTADSIAIYVDDAPATKDRISALVSGAGGDAAPSGTS